MDAYPHLQELEELINKCVLCGGCHGGCPTYDLTRYEHDSARGRVFLAQAVLKGEISPSAELAEKFGHCLTCFNCVESCPAGADPVRVINAARGEMFSHLNGGLPAKVPFGMLSRKYTLNIFFRLIGLAAKIFSSLPPLPFMPFVKSGVKRVLPDFSGKRLREEYPEVITAKQPAMRVGYFVGCMANSAFKDTGRAVIEVLRAAGVEVVLPEGEVCCGAPAYFAGDFQNARKAAENNLAAFSGQKLDYIVTSCATCGSVLKDIYPKLIEEEKGKDLFANRVIDFNQLVSNELWPKLKFIDPGENTIKVTYHDPCHLSRGMKVRSEPRFILKNLPGVDFVEMDEPCKCCGGSGLFSLKYYDDALEIGEKKARNIASSGADMVATACPSCRMQLEDVLNRFGNGANEIKTTHPAILLRQRLRK